MNVKLAFTSVSRNPVDLFAIVLDEATTLHHVDDALVAGHVERAAAAFRDKTLKREYFATLPDGAKARAVVVYWSPQLKSWNLWENVKTFTARALRLAAVVMAKASDQIVDKGRRVAAWLLEAAADDVEFSARRFRVRGTDRSVDLFEVARAAARADAPADVHGPLDGLSDETMPLPSYPYGTAVCEGEGDPDTGEVSVVRYTTVDDCGRAVNPMILHGQTHGGIAQGVGQAL
jgi:CO/xanthine dehydrogenase Mo-binding subunit